MNQKTQEILMQHLNEKSREIEILTQQNKDLRERLHRNNQKDFDIDDFNNSHASKKANLPSS